MRDDCSKQREHLVPRSKAEASQVCYRKNKDVVQRVHSEQTGR